MPNGDPCGPFPRPGASLAEHIQFFQCRARAQGRTVAFTLNQARVAVNPDGTHRFLRGGPAEAQPATAAGTPGHDPNPLTNGAPPVSAIQMTRNGGAVPDPQAGIFGDILRVGGGALAGLATGGIPGAIAGGAAAAGLGGGSAPPTGALPGRTQPVGGPGRTPGFGGVGGRPPMVPISGFAQQQQQECPPGTVRLGNTCIRAQFPVQPPISFEPPRVPGAGGVPSGAFAQPAPGQAAPAPGLGCPKGMRPNKSSYFLRDGTFVAEGTKCVKIRRRNPLNPRALDRAMSRLSSAKKAAKKLGRVTIRKKKC